MELSVQTPVKNRLVHVLLISCLDGSVPEPCRFVHDFVAILISVIILDNRSTASITCRFLFCMTYSCSKTFANAKMYSQ